MVVPIELLRQSEMHQAILNEGREEDLQKGLEEGRQEGRETLINLLRGMAARRFPGFTLGAEAERIQDLEALEQICYELYEIPDAATLRQRLAALSVAPESSNNGGHTNGKGHDNS